MTDPRTRLLRLLGLHDVTDDEIQLFRDHNIIRRPLKKERLQAALHNGEAIQCPECDLISHNPTDVAKGYCGHCHAFTSAPEWPLMKAALTLPRHPAVAFPPVRVNLAATAAETPPDQPLDS